MEIPRKRSTTGESPLYDLRFRWAQARHFATPEGQKLRLSDRRSIGALGEGYAGSGDHAKAEEELRTAIKLNPNDTVAKYLLLLSLIAHGQKTEAEALLSGLVNTGSQDAQIYYHLGQLQLERGDEKAAVGNLEVAAKMTLEDETIHGAMAEAYRKNDQPQEAERESELLQALQTRHTRVSFPDANAPAAGVSTKPN